MAGNNKPTENKYVLVADSVEEFNEIKSTQKPEKTVHAVLKEITLKVESQRNSGVSSATEPQGSEEIVEQTPRARAFECFSKIVETMSAGRHCGFDKELMILLNLVRNNGLTILEDFVNRLRRYPMASAFSLLLRANFDKNFKFKVIMKEIIKIVEAWKTKEVVSLRVAEETHCPNRLPEGTLDSLYDRDFAQESLDEDERRFKEVLREYKERVDKKLIEIAHWIEKELIKTSIIPQAEVPIKAKELYDLLEESEFHKETLEKSFEVDENIENEIFPIILNKLKEKLGLFLERKKNISKDEILRIIYIADGAVSQDNAPL